MHIYLWFLLVFIIIVITLAYASNGKHSFILFVFTALSLAGVAVGVLFPLLATRIYESEDVTITTTYKLTGIAHDGGIVYLVEAGTEGFQFVYFDKETGLNLGNVSVADVSLTYQEGVNLLKKTEVTSTFHSEWKMLRDSTTVKRDYNYHFFIPRDAVWYPYETN